MSLILLLPDEIKIKIFEYLDGIDKMVILNVCKDFQRIGQDKDVLHHLNFCKNYKLSLSQIKFIGRKLTAPTVLHINLNGVHWIPSAALRDALIKFINLNTLYVLDTQLSFRDLVKVTETTTKVQKLAFSMKPDNCADVFKCKLTLPLTHLFVTYNSFSIRALMTLLVQFKELEELWIIEPKRPCVIQFLTEEATWLNYVNDPLPTVTKKIVCSRQCAKIPCEQHFFDSLKDKSKTWNSVVMNPVAETYFYISEVSKTPIKNITKHSCSTAEDYRCKIQFTVKVLITKVNSVNSLNLTYRISEETIYKDNWVDGGFHPFNAKPGTVECNETKIKQLFSDAARQIQKMKCDSKIFWHDPETKTQAEEKELFSYFKKRRIGISTSKADDNCKFKKFAEYATEIEEFELDDMDPKGTRDNLWQIENLTFAQNWKILKKLTISSVNFHSGKFLIDITQNCPMLNCLKIQDDLVQDNLSANLCKALQFATNLKDFRYERKGGIPVDNLFEALAECSKLERLYLQCRIAFKISKKPLETVIARCENLVVLFIFISELHETVCKSIKQSIIEFGVKPQQIINIRGQSYNLNNITYEDIPTCHVEEIVCQDNDTTFDYIRSFF